MRQHKSDCAMDNKPAYPKGILQEEIGAINDTGGKN